MLKDAIRCFNKYCEKEGEDLVIHSHIPENGDYVVLDEDNGQYKILARFAIKNNKKDQTIEGSDNEYYAFVREADYLSRYIYSNKAVSNKNIQSNNYLTFFFVKSRLYEKIKRKTGEQTKINADVINEYFETLKNPHLKYKKPVDREAYKEVEKKLGPPDIEEATKFQEWLRENIYSLVPLDEATDEKLKIFVKKDIELYKKESSRYYLMKIYNTTDYNTVINNETHGLPKDSITLNSKKPFLENRTRKNSISYLITMEEAVMQKRFFDYLKSQLSLGKRNTYINSEEVISFSDKEQLSKDFSGYYFRVATHKQLGVIVEDFEVIDSYEVNIEPIEIQKIIKINSDKARLEYIKVYEKPKLSSIINEVLFGRELARNYFSKPKDIDVNPALKRAILMSREALFNWFYKGRDEGIWNILDHVSINLIKDAINNNYTLIASERFNLRISLKEYFGGGGSMKQDIKEIREKLYRVLTDINDFEIETDGEYYYIFGQLARYLVSLNKGDEKKHSLANSILYAKTNEGAKKELHRFFGRYNYSISMYNHKFNKLFAAVLVYNPGAQRPDSDYIVAGYLSDNMIYAKLKGGEDDE